MALSSYRGDPYWKRYQPFFPERLRIPEGGEPEETFWPWRGAELHLDRYRHEAPRFRAILLHGGGGNGRLLGPIGRMLWLSGGECVAPDLPGYGLSRVPPALFDYAAWIDAVVDLAEAEHRRAPLPLFFLGLSLGGMLAYQAAAASRVPVTGVIATTLCDPRDPAVGKAFARNDLLAWLAPRILPPASEVAGGLRVPLRWFCKMDAVSNDPRLAALVCRDPMGGGNDTPVRFLRSLFEMVPAVEPEAFDRCPVLLAHPGADAWTPLSVSRPFFDRLKGPRELVVLEGCGHIPIEQPGVARFEEALRAFLSRTLDQGALPTS